MKKEEFKRYKLNIRSVSIKDGTVDIPSNAIILGGTYNTPVISKDDKGNNVMSVVTVIYYLTELDNIDKKNKKEVR